MQRWTAATGREWRFEPGPRTVRFGTPPTGYIGWNDGTTVVLKETWRNGEQLDRLVLHELGHYYPTETEHSALPGVMSLGGMGATCITRADVRHLCVSDRCRAENPEC